MTTHLNFNITPSNSQFGDSAFFVSNIYTPSKYLIDCGQLSFKFSQLNSIKYVFISHTHMDHFYGFDKIIRSFINSGEKITIYGPKNIADNIRSKIMGYSWNLISGNSLNIVAVDIEQEMLTTLISSENGFNMVQIENEALVGNESFVLEDNFKVSYQKFDHDITSLGYKIEEYDRVKLNEAKIDELNYIKHSWIRDLKNFYLRDEPSGELKIKTKEGNSVTIEAKDLFYLLEHIPSQSIAYITDCAPTQKNIEKAISLSKEVDVLLIETVFTKVDKEHAIAKKHLSTDAVSEIIKQAKPKYFYPFHFSSRYSKNRSLITREIAKFDSRLIELYKNNYKT